MWSIRVRKRYKQFVAITSKRSGLAIDKDRIDRNVFAQAKLDCPVGAQLIYDRMQFDETGNIFRVRANREVHFNILHIERGIHIDERRDRRLRVRGATENRKKQYYGQ